MYKPAYVFQTEDDLKAFLTNALWLEIYSDSFENTVEAVVYGPGDLRLSKIERVSFSRD